jgi:hypothetical protein
MIQEGYDMNDMMMVKEGVANYDGGLPLLSSSSASFMKSVGKKKSPAKRTAAPQGNWSVPNIASQAPIEVPPAPVVSNPADTQSSSNQVSEPKENDPPTYQEANVSKVEITDGKYTDFPRAIEKRFEVYQTDVPTRPTIIKLGSVFTHKKTVGLISAPVTDTLGESEQKTQLAKALDLIDALTKSGDLPLSDCQVHIINASTQYFEDTLMDTLIKKNRNPIEPLERSTMILASFLHSAGVSELVNDEEKERLLKYSPALVDL